MLGIFAEDQPMSRQIMSSHRHPQNLLGMGLRTSPGKLSSAPDPLEIVRNNQRLAFLSLHLFVKDFSKWDRTNLFDLV